MSDNYDWSPEEAGEVKNMTSGGSFGVICPKRNKSIDKPCRVCDKVSALYNTNDKSDRDLAGRKKAKLSYFLNVVHASNQERSFILEVGANAGGDIVEGVRNKGWTDISHPTEGKGREIQITKQKGGDYNKYPVSPCLNKADWSIPKEVLDNLPNLDNIFDMLKKGELNEENYMHIKSIKDGETFQFRVCPPSKDQTVFGRSRLAPVFRHWGVSEGEITGEIDIDWKSSESGESTGEPEKLPWDEQKDPAGEPAKKKEPSCLGNSKFFDEKDRECYKGCSFFKECKSKIEANS